MLLAKPEKAPQNGTCAPIPDWTELGNFTSELTRLGTHSLPRLSYERPGKTLLGFPKIILAPHVLTRSSKISSD